MSAGDIYLHLRWTVGGQEMEATQATFGPWPVRDDLSHLNEIAEFVDRWRAMTGVADATVTLMIPNDPAVWLAEHPPTSTPTTGDPTA